MLSSNLTLAKIRRFSVVCQFEYCPLVRDSIHGLSPGMVKSLLGGYSLILATGPRSADGGASPLLLVLPPIVHSSAVAMSWREFRFNLRPISMLAVGCVLFMRATRSNGLIQPRARRESAPRRQHLPLPPPQHAWSSLPARRRWQKRRAGWSQAAGHGGSSRLLRKPN
jgi:hypothetical protein